MALLNEEQRKAEFMLRVLRGELPDLNDYDWQEVFKYSLKNGTNDRYEGGLPEPIGLAKTFPFGSSDVAEIIAIQNGCQDEEEWVGVFLLKNGFYGCVTAGCDYTGWG